MKKYEAPRIDIVKLDDVDIIQTSGLTLQSSFNIGTQDMGKGVIVPIPTASNDD